MKRIAVLILVTVLAAGVRPGPASARSRVPDLKQPTVPNLEEFGIRVEEALGTPDCPPAQVEAEAEHCAGDGWLSTRSPNFVTIKKRAFLRGESEIPQGVQVSASFVASEDASNVAIHFSAEARVVDDLPGTDRRMFVQALVDGQPVQPADVVFAVGQHEATRAFVFTTRVDEGIHTVEMRWRVDDRATAYLRDASLLVRTGRGSEGRGGHLVTETPESGPNQETKEPSWSNVPGLGGAVHVGSAGVLTATMSAESAVTGGKRIGLRALVDGAPMAPSDVVFAKGHQPQSRTMTFGAHGLAEGFHDVVIQWQVETGGTGIFGDRTLVLAAYPTSDALPTHPFVSPPSGPSVETLPGLSPMPGMATTVEIPARGNGELAILLSAEVGTTGGGRAAAVAAIDGALLNEGAVELTDGSAGAQVASWVFEAKGLEPGSHEVEIWWGGGPGKAYAGDRTLAILSEVGFVPDLAEAPRFGGGHIGLEEDHIGGLEALIGSRPVLAVLLDPDFCTGDLGSVASPDTTCYDQSTVPAAKVAAALWGTGGSGGALTTFEPNNVASYLSAMSDGRFTIAKAGVSGWHDSDHPKDHYYDHPGTCIDGFDAGSHHLVSEAVSKADPGVEFSAYDVNRDGRLETNELAIVVVVPRPNGDGSNISPLFGATCPGSAVPLVLDGTELPPYVVKWNTSLDDAVEKYQFATAAHELMHLLAGLDDLHLTTDVATYPRKMELMASNRWTTTHLSPFHKLALGWIDPVLVTDPGEYTAQAVETSHRVHVLPRYLHDWEEEYYLIENRQEGLGAEFFDEDLPDEGIGVWHIVSDPVANQNAPIGVAQDDWDASHIPSDKPGSQGQMGRNGIRLIRPFDDIEDGNAVFDDKDETQWDKSKYSLKSGDCLLVVPTGQAFQNRLTWADCQPSGYNLDFLSWSSHDMQFRVTLG